MPPVPETQPIALAVSPADPGMVYLARNGVVFTSVMGAELAIDAMARGKDHDLRGRGGYQPDALRWNEPGTPPMGRLIGSTVTAARRHADSDCSERGRTEPCCGHRFARIFCRSCNEGSTW